MVAISFRFLAGRFHATPWGRHVNEGAVEWPPSPWRILRALVATWKRTLPSLETDRVRAVLEAISEAPEFLLPLASTGHTRHFMPLRKGAAAPTLVFDTFVVLSKAVPVVVRWPEASLDQAQKALLARILTNLGTLGRSESWCSATLDEEVDSRNLLCCRPARNGGSHGTDKVRVLCPDPATAFADDHVVNVRYDPAWNLCMETLQLHAERWSMPPGARWVDYARPRECFDSTRGRRPSVCRRRGPRIQVVRYALDSTVLPLITETLPVAEAARRTLMGIHGRLTETDGTRGRSAVFSGKDAYGARLSGHGHAYYLPSDEDGDGRLDHLTVFARGGFGGDEQRALDRLRKLRTGRDMEERHELHLLLLGMGLVEDYRPGPLARATIWESVTPYVAARYAKTRGRDRVDLGSVEQRCAFLIADLKAQLYAVRGIDPASVRVEPMADENGAFRIAARRPIQFKRYRRKASDDGGRRLAGAFRIVFAEPVAGPVCLGHSCHFGLGLFRARGKHP